MGQMRFIVSPPQRITQEVLQFTYMAGMDRMLEAQKAVGALSGNVNWAKIIDRRFLPADQQKDY